MCCAVKISYILNKFQTLVIYVLRKLNHTQILDELRDCIFVLSITQLTLTYPKLSIETLEEGVKYVQS